MLNIVLLGGTGFVGSAIIRKAEEEKNKDVNIRALVRGNRERINSPSVTVIEGELPDRIPADLFPDEPHVVVHFGTKQIDTDGSGFHKSNVEGTRNLAASLPPSSKGIIYGSSMSVYGQEEQETVSENQPVNPQTDLAKTRVEAENIILDLMKKSDRTGFVLRPRFILGNGDKFTLKGFKTIAKKGLIIGSGKQSYSIIDVDDYAEIIISLARSVINRDEEKSPIVCPFNIGYKNPVSFNFLLNEICCRKDIEFPAKKVPFFGILRRILRILPIASANNFATKLELVGLSHSGSVINLKREIGTDITDKYSSKVFMKILEESSD